MGATLAPGPDDAPTVRKTVCPDTIVSDWGWLEMLGPPEPVTVRNAGALVVLPPAPVTITA
jgi:hypothetical protein